MTQSLDGIAPLKTFGVIRAAGDDAVSFLQGQLTNDFALIGASEARLAAYCSPKGRMLATFVGVQLAPADILLITPRDTLPATLKRLSMFVMRAKARLSDATDQFDVYGVAGPSLAGMAPALDKPWSKQDIGGGIAVALYPAQGQPRALWIAPAGTPAPALPALSDGAWAWSEVASGIAMVSVPLVEALVPQMLNYESVGGVNFRKGCYPGQEVVARSQFRGTLKRRAFIAHAESSMEAGQEIFRADDADQPVGIVAQSAAAPGGGFDAIVSMQIAAADGGALYAGSAQGTPLTVQPAPYPLLADV